MRPTAAPKKVLLVEDDHLVARGLTRLLSKIGFETVAHASSASEAVPLAKSMLPDVAMVDINLQGDGDGIDAAGALAQGSPVPVVFMSGLVDNSVIARAVSAGGYGLLSKPCRMEDIQAALLVAMERHRHEIALREREAVLTRDSLEDALTGLCNRRGFMERAGQLMSLARRQSRPVTLFSIDLDGLKTVNDTLGHETGDRMIAAAGRVFKETFRTADVVSRLGGDEFTILTIDAQPTSILRRLKERINQFNDSAEASFTLAMSIGFVVSSDQNEDLMSVLARSDLAMYAEKQRRKAAPLHGPQLHSVAQESEQQAAVLGAATESNRKDHPRAASTGRLANP
jgi:diguanylate cyclase (GGDEF)-like protein